MKTRHFLMMATLAVGMAMTGMMMTSCAKEDNPVDNSTDGPSVLPVGTTIRKDIPYIIYSPYNDRWEENAVPTEFRVLDGLYEGIFPTSELKMINYHGVKSSRIKVKIPYFVYYGREDYYVSRISSEAFFHLRDLLVEVELNFAIKRIDIEAFRDCINLEKVEFDIVKSIGGGAFINCTSLKELKLSRGGSLDIERRAFENCTGLTNVQLKADTLMIDQSAFNNCTGLKSLILEGSMEAIEVETFMDCTSLKGISFPYGLKTIKSQAFKNCTSLEKLELPDGLKTIESQAFKNCTSLEELYLPGGIEKIDKKAFEGCENLKKVIFHGNAPLYEHGTFPEGAHVYVE